MARGNFLAKKLEACSGKSVGAICTLGKNNEIAGTCQEGRRDSSQVVCAVSKEQRKDLRAKHKARKEAKRNKAKSEE